jgi:hypothetical protein
VVFELGHRTVDVIPEHFVRRRELMPRAKSFTNPRRDVRRRNVAFVRTPDPSERPTSSSGCAPPFGAQ